MKLTSQTPQSLDLFSRISKILSRNFFPAVNVYEKSGLVCFDAELPGIQLDDIQTKIENNHLIISGAAKNETEIDDEHYYRKEIKKGFFERRIPLPENVDAQTLHKSIENGILKITFKKTYELSSQEDE